MPDLIVCDFYTRVGAEIFPKISEVADQLKIPTVLNVPGMVDMCHKIGNIENLDKILNFFSIFSKIGMSGVFDMNNAKSYCG